MTRILQPALTHQSIGLRPQSSGDGKLHIQVCWHNFVTFGLVSSTNEKDKENIYGIYKEKENTALFRSPVGPESHIVKLVWTQFTFVEEYFNSSNILIFVAEYFNSSNISIFVEEYFNSSNVSKFVEQYLNSSKDFIFLAVQNSSIGDLVTHSLCQSVTHFYFCHTKSNPRDLLPLRHLIRVMRRHDL